MAYVIVNDDDSTLFWDASKKAFVAMVSGDYTVYQTGRMAERSAKQLRWNGGYRVEVMGQGEAIDKAWR